MQRLSACVKVCLYCWAESEFVRKPCCSNGLYGTGRPAAPRNFSRSTPQKKRCWAY